VFLLFLFGFFPPFLVSIVHVVGALSSVSGSINDMLVQSYRQVAEMACDERQYERAMVCYERLIICLRSRSVKTENTLQLMQKSIREIVAIKMIELKPDIANKVRKLHALHDPHKNIHQQNKEIFRKVISMVMRRSPGEYFEDLMVQCNMYSRNDIDTKRDDNDDVVKISTPRDSSSDDTCNIAYQIELACLVELSNSV
jgi:hypothetical protein